MSYLKNLRTTALLATTLMGIIPIAHAMDPEDEEMRAAALRQQEINSLEAQLLKEQQDAEIASLKAQLAAQAETIRLQQEAAAREEEQKRFPQWNSQLKNTLGDTLPDGWSSWHNPAFDAPLWQQEQEGELTGTGHYFGIYHPLDLSQFIGKTVVFSADIKSDNPGPYCKLETHEEFWSSLHKGNNKWENLSMKYVVEPADSYVVYFETKHPASFTMKNLDIRIDDELPATPENVNQEPAGEKVIDITTDQDQEGEHQKLAILGNRTPKRAEQNVKRETKKAGKQVEKGVKKAEKQVEKGVKKVFK